MSKVKIVIWQESLTSGGTRYYLADIDSGGTGNIEELVIP